MVENIYFSGVWYGVVVSVGWGFIIIRGFISAYIGEIFRALGSSGIYCFGTVVNIARDAHLNLFVSGLVLEVDSDITEGSIVESMGVLCSLRLGDFILSSILDSLGNVVINSRRCDSVHQWLIESPSPSIVERLSVFEPLQTGLISVDSMIPIGRGQRELLVGDRQTGKTSIGVDTIINQKYEEVLSIYVPVGQKSSAILEVFLCLAKRDSLFYMSLVVASASKSSVCQYLCAYTGAALAEFYMLVNSIPLFVMFDDLSKHAVAYREIYLLLRRPPGREAYPGEIFFVHSKLLERSSKLSYILGGGSSTCFPVIETLSADVSAYITTNVISITDGQIFLSLDMFLSNLKPACDIGLSVTRVGSSAQWAGMRLVSGSYKLDLAQYRELKSFLSVLIWFGIWY